MAAISTGYGPLPSGVSASIPIFDGKREQFDDFKYKLRAVALELGFDDLLFNPDGFAATMAAAERRAALRGGEATAHAQASQQGPTVEALTTLKKQAARILVSRLSSRVTDTMRRVLPEDKQFDATSIWNHLVKTYDTSAASRRAAGNLEAAALSLLRLRWDKERNPSLLSFVRLVQHKLNSLFAHSKLASTEGARKLMAGLTLRYVLDIVGEDYRWQSVRDKFILQLVDSNDLPAAQIFDQFVTDVEKLEVSLPSASFAKSRRGGGPGRGGAGAGAGAYGGNRDRGNDGGHAQVRPPGPGAAKKPMPNSKYVHHKATVSVVDGAHCDGTAAEDGNGDDACFLGAIASTMALVSSKKEKVFLVDSGATHHCVREKSLFSNFRPGKHVVRVADSKAISAVGKGDVSLQTTTDDGRRLILTLRDVFFVPALTNNIFSTNRFCHAGSANSVSLGADKILQTPHGKVTLLNEHGLVWLVAGKVARVPTAPAPALAPAPAPAAVPAPTPAQAAPTMTLRLFHERMGHVNVKDCSALAAQQGIKLLNTADFHCDVCATAKQRKQPMPDLAVRRDVRPGEILHCDIKGPLDASYSKAKYALVIVDEATRMVAAKEMRSKDQSVDALQSIIAMFASHPSKHIVVGTGSIVHSDSEAVLKSRGMAAFLASKGITPRASPPHTHERNGIVERAIQTVFDTARALLQQAELEDKFWPIAMHHAVYLRNRSPTQALGGRSPFHELTGSVPEITKLHKFGCKVFVRVDDSSRRALDPKSRAGIYVGHSDLSDSFRVLVRNPTRWDIVDSVHCTFHESELGITAVAPDPSGPGSAMAAAPVPSVHVHAPTRPPPPPSRQQLLAQRDPLLDDFSDDEDEAQVSALLVGDGSTPSNYRIAMQSRDAASWTAAIKSEIDSLIANGTFETAPDATVGDRKVLSTRWVFTRKHEPDGSIRFKARLVARGDHQRAGLDYNQVYSPVVNATTLRALIAVAAVNDYELDQMDAVTAFLNAPLDEEMFLRIPDGFAAQPGHVLRLKKSLYGLKQAPRCWNQMLHDWLLSYGLKQSEVDSCLYFLPGKLWVAFWVDDFIVMSSSVAVKDAFKAAISKQFKMRDLGAIDQFLGMVITRDRANRVLTLASTQHVDDMLARYGLEDAKPQHTPLPCKCILVPRAPDEDPLPASTPYRGVVGSLLYVAMWTRPDIAFAVSQIARFQSDPTEHHWQCAKHILRYLKGTRQYGLTFSASQHAPPVLRGYVDASWGEDLSTRKSQSGYIFTLGNAAISWKSALQKTVALSSTEAEYLALSAAVKDALFLRNLMTDLWPALATTVTLFEDNQSTIKQASNLQSSDRTKHVDIRHHFLKEHVANGNVALEYLPTSDQVADALTKNLDRIKVSLFRQIMLGYGMT